MSMRDFRPGDPVIFRKTKTSTCPGPRAMCVHPQGRGETYTYQVDKFWVVDRPLEGGMLLVRTRRGKVHRIHADDPHLRRVNLLEWWLYRDRFPERAAATH